MSRHAVYLSSALVLLSAVAQTAAQDKIWTVNSLGDDGTSPNQGCMIQWCPAPVWAPLGNPWVHATWVSGDTAWYSRSTDEGQTWDDPPTLVPSYHTFAYRPALRVGPGASAWVCKRASDAVPGFLECAVKPPPPSPWTLGNVAWGGISKFPVATALSTTSDTPMVYMVTTVWNPDGSGAKNKLCFWAFDTIPPCTAYVTKELVGSTLMFDFQASIDYEPGDRPHIVYRTQEGMIEERTWARPLSPSKIRQDSEPTWSGPYPVYDTMDPVQVPGSHPFIDMYGEFGFCAWRGLNAKGETIGEIYRAQLPLNQPAHPWEEQRRVTSSESLESDFPQFLSGTTITWQEQTPDSNTEIYGMVELLGARECISNAPGFMNWGPQASVKNPVPPNFPPVFRCHTLWSQEEIEGQAKYIHYRRHDFVPADFAGFEYPTYLKPILGRVEPSPFCLERDGYVDYGNHRVDYGRSRLVYDLPYLDPASDYLAQFTLFNGELSPITQSIKLGNVSVARKTLRPGVCETLYAYIPRDAYRSTHARLEVTRESGPFACLARDIRVYETYRTRANGGAQARIGPAAKGGLSARPNPYRERTIISSDGARPGSLFRIYDTGGRLVRILRAEGRTGEGCAAIWDGTAADGRTLPPGVYTCVSNTGSTAALVRVVRH